MLRADDPQRCADFLQGVGVRLRSGRARYPPALPLAVRKGSPFRARLQPDARLCLAVAEMPALPSTTRSTNS